MAEIIYNTGNEVPSSDPRDRHDNTVNLDKAVNDLVALTFVDRKGVTRDTYAGIVAKAAKVLATGQIYTTTDEALAAGVKWFSIVSPLEDETFILYENVDGLAVERKRFPSAESINEMHGLISMISGGSASDAVVVSDDSGFVILKVLSDGSIDQGVSNISSVSGGDLEVVGVDGFLINRIGSTSSDICGLNISLDPENSGIYFVDEAGFIVGKIDNYGAFFGGKETGGSENYAPSVASLGQQKRTQIKQNILYGQSLARGNSSFPPLSTSQPYENVMLKGGTLPRYGEIGYDASELVPLIEQVYQGEGETPVTAYCNGVTRRAVEAGELASNWVFAGMSPGRGGRTVEQLSPRPLGDGIFEKMISEIKDCKRLADEAGKTYSVWSYMWVQGESNNAITGNTSAYEYAQNQMNVFDSMTLDVMEITGQEYRPYLFTYQVNAHRRYAREKMPIALSQWRLSKSRDDVCLFSPAYIFPVVADNLHLTNVGSWLMGEYAAKAMYQTMIGRGEKWRPLEPVSVTWLDDRIEVDFYAPSGSLVIDGALAASAENMGFDLWKSDDSIDDCISSVSVTSSTRVTILLSRKADYSSVLSYARGRPGDVSGPVIGARGNLRDTSGDFDVATAPDGSTHKLHNACVAFEYSRKAGL